MGSSQALPALLQATGGCDASPLGGGALVPLAVEVGVSQTIDLGLNQLACG